VDRMIVVSADGHAGPPPEDYGTHLEKNYHDALDELIAENNDFLEVTISQRKFNDDTLDLIDRDDAIRSGGELGAWDIHRRLAELDREGVAGEVVIPGHQLSVLPFFSVMTRAYSPELRAAGIRAYHRFLAEMLADADGRLVGVAEPGACVDIDATIAELRWVADHGYTAVTVPGSISDGMLPPLFDASFEPFWAACADLGLVLNVHAGYGLPQGMFSANLMKTMTGDMSDEERLKLQTGSEIRIDQLPKDSPIRVALTAPRRVFSQLMLGGVFDRYPGLKLVLTEVRADWVPATIARLDEYVAEHGIDLPKSPREYWHDHGIVAPSSPRPYELKMRDEIGVKNFLFGMDYPHPEGTWPNSREWIQDAFAGVSEDDARLILGENAVDCYRFDRAKLAAVAERIGPKPSDLLGGTKVAPELTQQFHERAGYQRPQEIVDVPMLDEMLDDDRELLAAQHA
jgi:predicted TIM-barrel fold metal-dependent hydrolase